MAAILLSLWLAVVPYGCPSGAECRTSADCGSCECIDGYCE